MVTEKAVTVREYRFRLVQKCKNAVKCRLSGVFPWPNSRTPPKTSRNVTPIFGWSLASYRTIKKVSDSNVGRWLFFRTRHGCEALQALYLYVCPFCLPARISQEPQVQISSNFLYITCGRVSVRRQCNTLRIFGFLDDVTFSHNEANRPASKTTRMFRTVCQVAAPGETCCLRFYFVDDVDIFWCSAVSRAAPDVLILTVVGY